MNLEGDPELIVRKVGEVKLPFAKIEAHIGQVRFKDALLALYGTSEKPIAGTVAVAERLGVSKATAWRWLKALGIRTRPSAPPEHLGQIGREAKEEERVVEGRRVKLITFVATPKLAYLAGFAAYGSDGTVTSKAVEAFNKETALLEPVREAMELFGRVSKTPDPYPGFWRLVVCNAALADLFGTANRRRWDTWDKLTQAQAWPYIAGLWDAEGSISCSKEIDIDISMANASLIYRLKYLLARLGIATGAISMYRPKRVTSVRGKTIKQKRPLYRFEVLRASAWPFASNMLPYLNGPKKKEAAMAIATAGLK